DLLNVQISDKEAVESKKSETESTKNQKIEKMVVLEALKEELSAQTAASEEDYKQLTNDISLAASHRESLVAERQAFEDAQRIAAEQAAAAQAQAIAEAEAAESGRAA